MKEQSPVGRIWELGEKEHGAQMVEFKDYNIEVKDVSFGYHDDKEILNNISLSVPQNGMTALVGPSG